MLTSISFYQNFILFRIFLYSFQLYALLKIFNYISKIQYLHTSNMILFGRQPWENFTKKLVFLFTVQALALGLEERKYKHWIINLVCCWCHLVHISLIFRPWVVPAPFWNTWAPEQERDRESETASTPVYVCRYSTR